MAWDLIIFDCDGVLVDSEKISNYVFAEEARKLGASVTNEEALELFAGTSLKFCMDYVSNQNREAIASGF